MKLVLIGLLSWAVGMVAALALYLGLYREMPSGPDLMGVLVLSLIVTQVAAYALYAPGLFWLRRRLGGTKPAGLFVLASALILNLPAFVVMGLAVGDRFQPTEALMFGGLLVLFGAVFALGFTSAYRPQPSAIRAA